MEKENNKHNRNRTIIIVAVFLAAMAAFCIWLFQDDSDMTQEVEFSEQETSEAVSESEGIEISEQNAELQFYIYQPEDSNGEYTEYITLNPAKNEFTLSIITDFDMDSIKEATGEYEMTDSDITVTLDDETYKGKITNIGMELNGKEYIKTDESYI